MDSTVCAEDKRNEKEIIQMIFSTFLQLYHVAFPFINTQKEKCLTLEISGVCTDDSWFLFTAVPVWCEDLSLLKTRLLVLLPLVLHSPPGKLLFLKTWLMWHILWKSGPSYLIVLSVPFQFHLYSFTSACFTLPFSSLQSQLINLLVPAVPGTSESLHSCWL